MKDNEKMQKYKFVRVWHVGEVQWRYEEGRVWAQLCRHTGTMRAELVVDVVWKSLHAVAMIFVLLAAHFQK